MALKKNIGFNYISQIYVIVLGIIISPLYLKYMGGEAFGLVGFFTMLNTWFCLLDIGLTPTVMRETARFRGGALDPLGYSRLINVLEILFFSIAMIGGLFIFGASEYITNHWLQLTDLPKVEVQIVIQMMAVTIALRWMCGLYRGTISGSEKLVWLSNYNILIATLRFVGALIVLIFIGSSAKIFFTYQLIVAVIEIAGLILKHHQLLPEIQTEEKKQVPWSWHKLASPLKFSLTIAFTASIWVFVTQTDKLILSKFLPLTEYGYFTLATMVAGGVMVMSGPVISAILPRMARLEAEGQHQEMIYVYQKTTQFVALITGAACITILLFSKSLLWAWTGNMTLSNYASPILILYTIGNALLAIGAFPYYLQYAKGNLRLHFIGNMVSAIILVPAIIWATNHYGAIGAGWVWLIMNMIIIGMWVPYVHHKVEPGINKEWYKQILKLYLVMLSMGSIVASLMPVSDNRIVVSLQMIAAGVIIIFSGVQASFSKGWRNA